MDVVESWREKISRIFVREYPGMLKKLIEGSVWIVKSVKDVVTDMVGQAMGK